jgi:hypothetical protein
MTYPKKAQVLLTEEQYEALEAIASQEHKKMSTLVREAVDLVYLQGHRQKRIKKALDRILDMSLPTTDWETFEREYTSQKGK